MGIMRAVIKWCDKKMDEAYVEENDFKGGCKAFGSGFVEGFCDGCIIAYPILITTLCVASLVANKNE